MGLIISKEAFIVTPRLVSRKIKSRHLFFCRSQYWFQQKKVGVTNGCTTALLNQQKTFCDDRKGQRGTFCGGYSICRTFFCCVICKCLITGMVFQMIFESLRPGQQISMFYELAQPQKSKSTSCFNKCPKTYGWAQVTKRSTSHGNYWYDS